jgi:hypothetical protein
MRRGQPTRVRPCSGPTARRACADDYAAYVLAQAFHRSRQYRRALLLLRQRQMLGKKLEYTHLGVLCLVGPGGAAPKAHRLGTRSR